MLFSAESVDNNLGEFLPEMIALANTLSNSNNREQQVARMLLVQSQDHV